MENKKQTMRFNDSELSMIKNTFAENDVLLSALRKVFLQMELSDVDTDVITGAFKGKEALATLINKTFKPVLSADAPRHQLMDLWLTIDIKGEQISDLLPVFKARQLLIELLDQQLNAIVAIAEGEKVKETISIDGLTSLEGKKSEEFYVGLIARNTLIMHVEMQLHQLDILAGLKEETVEATKDKLAKDSAK